MSGYKELEIYNISFDLALQVHHASLKLPKFEIYEQGSQIRRASKSVKNNIAEGYGRKRYKAEYIRFLIFAHASCDETISQLDMLISLYPEIKEFIEIKPSYDNLGGKINKYIQYVENNWRV